MYGSANAREELAAIGRLSVPIALAQFGTNTIGLVDVAVLGHASSTDLGGAGIGRSINFAAIALGLGVAIAVEPLAAQAVGANDKKEAWRALLAALIACVLVWLPSALAGYLATYALAPLGIEQDLCDAARDFVVMQMPGMLALSFFQSMKAFLQAHQKTRPIVITTIVANLINIVVCNLLVRGDEALTAVHLPPLGLPHGGARGAGIANSIAMFALAAGLLLPTLRLREDRGEEPVPIRKALSLGVPIGLQLLVEIGVFSFVGVMAGKLGKLTVSAHQIALGLASFTFMGALGISGATAVQVGHAVGEGRPPKTAGRMGILLGAAFMTFSALAFLLFRRPLIAIFTDDPNVIEIGAGLLYIAAAFQLFDGIQVVATGALRGAADVRFAFVANVGAHWLVGLPLALSLAFVFHFGAVGLWIGLLAGLLVVSGLLVWRFEVIARTLIKRY